MEFDALSNEVIGCALEVHKELGPGLLESAYEECLAHEFRLAGLEFDRQKQMPVRYKEVSLDCGYRLDLAIGQDLVIELKTVEELLPIHEAQLLSYMKLGGFPVGLLINFRVPLLKQGIRRFVL